MSEITPLGRRLWRSPLRDLVRGRVTGRLDWRRRVAAAGLPAAAVAVIVQTVARSRLWRLEKAELAGELVAHFTDAAAAGTPTEKTVADFGDVRTAARLIRRAKIRQRPLPWRMLRWAEGGAAVLAVAYLAVSVVYWTGRPTVTVDYLAAWNRPVLATAPDQRAWPLYRDAALAADLHGNHIVDGVNSRAPWDDWVWEPVGGANDPRLVDWIGRHQTAVDLTRRGAARPILGFVLGPGGSQQDAALWGDRDWLAQTPAEVAEQGVAAVRLPYLTDVRELALLLRGDARVAMLAGDGARAVSDLYAIAAMADQLHATPRYLVTESVSLEVRGLMLDAIEDVLANHPALLSDAVCDELIAALQKPKVAADVICLDGYRESTLDLIQRSFTDDGHGDGRLTPSAARVLAMYGATIAPFDPWDTLPRDAVALFARPLAPLFSVSRRQATVASESQMQFFVSVLSRPLRDTRLPPDPPVTSIQKVTDLLARWSVAALRGMPATAERYLGRRDGMVLALACERFRRVAGRWPATLNQLVPRQLVALPVDRITGGPLHYHIAGDRPLIYSVGMDRDDDGGRAATEPNFNIYHRRNLQEAAAEWRSDAPTVDADWILYDGATAAAGFPATRPAD